MLEVKKFIIRVYGILLNSEQEILIAEEFHYNTFMRKFPGGGLEFGEGPIEGLKRELFEELQLDVKIGAHVHTTDFFVQSVFNKELQVIGIYFLVEFTEDVNSRYREPYEMPAQNGTERFRWVKVNELKVEEFTFPTDRKAYRTFLDLIKKNEFKWPSKI